MRVESLKEKKVEGSLRKSELEVKRVEKFLNFFYLFWVFWLTELEVNWNEASTNFKLSSLKIEKNL